MSKIIKNCCKKGIDYVGVTVSWMCHDGEGNFVWSKRGQNCRDEKGKWDLGGGGVDFGDTIAKTLEKELKEEYCVSDFESKFLGITDLFRNLDDQETHWIAVNFLVKVNRKQVKNGEPHKFDEVAWFRLNNLPTPIHSAMPIFLEKYKKEISEVVNYSF